MHLGTSVHVIMIVCNHGDCRSRYSQTSLCAISLQHLYGICCGSLKNVFASTYVSVCLCVIHTVFPTIYSIILYTVYSVFISTSLSPHPRPTGSGETPPNTQQR